MTNYSMQKGRKINDIIKVVKMILLLLATLFIIFEILQWSNIRDNKLMSIDYCWDSNGQHYVVPNENCNH